MKIELKKTEELSGEIWYRVYVDNWCDRPFQDKDNPDKALNDATEYYNTLLLRQQQGFPRTEIILTSGD